VSNFIIKISAVISHGTLALFIFLGTLRAASAGAGSTGATAGAGMLTPFFIYYKLYDYRRKGKQYNGCYYYGWQNVLHIISPYLRNRDFYGQEGKLHPQQSQGR